MYLFLLFLPPPLLLLLSAAAAWCRTNSLTLEATQYGNYVEVYAAPDAPHSDCWFLKGVDGSVIGTITKLFLNACAWCRTILLTIEPSQKEMVPVEIESTFDEGAAQKFEIVGSNGRVLLKVVKAKPVVIPAAAKLPTAAKLHISADIPAKKQKISQVTKSCICNNTLTCAYCLQFELPYRIWHRMIGPIVNSS